MVSASSSVGIIGIILAIILVIILLSIFVGLIFLQIFLSKRESKVPGLILPIISFVMALSMVGGITLYGGTDVFLGLFVTLVSNLPTGVYFAIYLSCRLQKHRLQKNSTKKQLEKMNIQDLG